MEAVIVCVYVSTCLRVSGSFSIPYRPSCISLVGKLELKLRLNLKLNQARKRYQERGRVLVRILMHRKPCDILEPEIVLEGFIAGRAKCPVAENGAH